jgi:hypothetical protein
MSQAVVIFILTLKKQLITILLNNHIIPVFQMVAPGQPSVSKTAASASSDAAATITK